MQQSRRGVCDSPSGAPNGTRGGLVGSGVEYGVARAE
jgi:hypothetical protein